MMRDSRSRHRRQPQRLARSSYQRSQARPAHSRRLAFCRRASSETFSKGASLIPRVPTGATFRVMTRAEVVCADGMDGVEAVVIRHAPTGSPVGGERVCVSLVRRSEE